MKLEELQDNRNEVMDSIIKKHPFVGAAIYDRPITVAGKKVLLCYKPREFISKKIAENYKDVIKEGIACYITDDFELVIETEEE